MSSARLNLSEKHPTRLDNSACCYCGARLSSADRTEDHVIGRRFVPIGSLAGSWNLIVKACSKCNLKKSDLEDDISSITMAHHLLGFTAMNNVKLQEEARRKAHRSTSRKTNKKVKDSSESISFQISPSPSLSISGNFSAPPQLTEERAGKLAMMQIMAFFFLLTYQADTNTGHYWPGEFYITQAGIKTDWGNKRFLHFMHLISSWDYRLIAVAADGFYKVEIRKHATSSCWAWAVEWNDCYRMVGLFGVVSHVDPLAAAFPMLDAQVLQHTASSRIYFRSDCGLDADQDLLFKTHADA